MKARLLLAVVLFAGLVVSCSTLRELHISAPPANPARAQQWWQQTLTDLDIDALAVYARVSEVLRGKGATAVYCFTTVKKRRLDDYSQSETHLPAPMPPAFRALVESRLAGYKRQHRKPPSADGDVAFSVEPGTGCTAEEALELWQQQEKQLGWK
jgi:hypothetical protein